MHLLWAGVTVFTAAGVILYTVYNEWKDQYGTNGRGYSGTHPAICLCARIWYKRKNIKDRILILSRVLKKVEYAALNAPLSLSFLDNEGSTTFWIAAKWTLLQEKTLYNHLNTQKNIDTKCNLNKCWHQQKLITAHLIKAELCRWLKWFSVHLVLKDFTAPAWQSWYLRPI